jgi:hypothetical protein
LAKSELLRLAEDGLAAFPPVRLSDLSIDCRQFAEATASARMFVLADVVGLLASAWEPHGAVPVKIRERLDLLLSVRMLSILTEEDEHAAVSPATSFREDLRLVLMQMG